MVIARARLFAEVLNNNRFGKGVDDGLSEREVFLSTGPMTSYNIEVHTGNLSGAGTDSNVHVTLFGEKVVEFYSIYGEVSWN
jgi:hypothetical protein